MIIGVISDTHVRTIDDISAKVLDALKSVDLIVHAGDFTHRAVLEGLKAMGEFRAVAGNMDSDEIKRILPRKEEFVLQGKKIGLVHGSGGPWGIAERVRELFSDKDIIIFGHSHWSYNEYVEGTLMFNPGQARESFGLLHIDDEIRGEIFRV